MNTPHSSPVKLSDALEQLAIRMEAHPGRISHYVLANLMSRVVDGPGASAHDATTQPELAKEMSGAIVPGGFISPVPDPQQVREAAATYRNEGR